MNRKSLIAVMLFLVFAVATVWAADISGKWEAEYQTPNGQTRQNTFNFEVKGDAVTGTVASARGENKIEEGKIKGEEISFVVIRNFNGNDMKFQYQGKIAGDEIKFKVTVGEGDRTFEMTAKRAK
jgi:hypothetical protein